MYGYIYLITNRVNGKIYVGQHKYDKMELDPNYHGSGVKLHKAYNKYGMNKFDTTLIDTADTKEELDQKEIFYIDTLDCRNPDVGYNITEGGGGVCGLCGEKNPMYGKGYLLEGENNGFYGKHHTEESKQKMRGPRPSVSGEKNPMYGKSAMKGKHQSEDTKQKISEANTNRKDTSKPVLQYTKSGEFVAEYLSAHEACRQTGINRSQISGCCNGVRFKSAGGFIWKWK